MILVSENVTRWLDKLLEPLFAEAGSQAACAQGALKKMTAEKKKAGKISRAAASKKNAAAMKKAGKDILDADFYRITIFFVF